MSVRRDEARHQGCERSERLEQDIGEDQPEWRALAKVAGVEARGANGVDVGGRAVVAGIVACHADRARIDVAPSTSRRSGFRRGNGEHASAGPNVEHERPSSPFAPRQGRSRCLHGAAGVGLWRFHQVPAAAARSAVMAGAEGQRSLDLDADAAHRDARARRRARRNDRRRPAGDPRGPCAVVGASVSNTSASAAAEPAAAAISARTAASSGRWPKWRVSDQRPSASSNAAAATSSALKLSVTASLTRRAVAASMASRASVVATGGEGGRGSILLSRPELIHACGCPDFTRSPTGDRSASTGDHQAIHKLRARFAQTCPEFCDLAAERGKR